MIDDLYRERLSAWVDAERERLGKPGAPCSFSYLEKRINLNTSSDRFIDRATLGKWQKKEIAREIAGAPLMVLAEYRKESIDQCRRWLEGKGEGVEKESLTEMQVRSWIDRCESISVLASMAGAISDRIVTLHDAN